MLCIFTTQDNHVLNALKDNVSFQEVYKIIRSMGAFKAPGPYGFQVVFYQSQWDMVGKALCSLV